MRLVSLPLRPLMTACASDAGVLGPAPVIARMWFRSLPLAAAALLLAVCASGADAQAVSATSGSPQAIARIRQQFAAIEREAPAYRRTVHNVHGFSLEGGELTGFFRGGELRKLHARLFGETWRGTEELYFADGRLVFAYVVHERYDEPLSGRVQSRIEHRLYFDGGRLIRRVRTQRPASEDLSMFDPDLPALLRDAELFAACAASPDPQAPQCTAPSS